MFIPLPESLRLRQQFKPCALLERISAAVEPRLSARTVNPIDNKPPGAVFTKPNNLWPCGTKDRPLVLHYSFFQPTNNTIRRNRESRIQTVMNHIEEQVPGVRFDLVNKDSEAVIRIAFNYEKPYGKTWSRVGREAERVNSDEPTMNLSDSEHEPGEIQEGSKEYGDILHEFFHTLGMLHEHQHPERKFTISATAVGKDLEDEGWSKDNIIRQFNRGTIGSYSPPDMGSCMKYNFHGEWTRDGSEVKRYNKPSDVDFAWLNLMYPSHDATKFEQALSKLMDSRISEEQKNSILKLYSDGEWDRVRSKILNVYDPKSKSSKKGVVGKLWAKHNSG